MTLPHHFVALELVSVVIGDRGKLLMEQGYTTFWIDREAPIFSSAFD